VIAANVSGPRRIQAGAARDFALGARFVDGAGRVIKNGGRVMKNVTGYDLVKLMAGSWGTLGVLTEVSLKVQAMPETEATLTLDGLDEATAIGAMAAALGSPWDVSGAAHGVLGKGAKTRLRIEGLEGSVAYRAAALADRLARFGAVGIERDPVASKAIWRAIRDVEVFAGRPFVARLSIKPSDLPEAVFELSNMFLGEHSRAPLCEVTTDWGGGLVWVSAGAEELAQAAAVAPEPEVDAETHGGRLLIEFLQSFVAAHGGHATLVKASDAVRAQVDVFQPQAAPLAAVTRSLKQKFDPRGILNPGLMGD